MKPFAQHLDELRVFPRLFMLGYGWMMAEVLFWAMSLPDLSTGQTVVLTTMTAIFPALLGFYVNTGKKWDEK